MVFKRGMVIQCTRIHRGESAMEGVFEYETCEGYDMRTVYKMYSDSLRSTKVSKNLDVKFKSG